MENYPKRVATHEITAAYYPNKKIIDLYWRDLESGDYAYLEVEVSEHKGEEISKVVPPCLWTYASLPD